MIAETDQIDAVIRNALVEDIGSGDVTTLNTIPADATLSGELLVKADGVVAGLDVFRRVFELVDPRVQVTTLAADGDRVQRGDIITTVNGPGQAILTGERLALNILQRMSGIATATRHYVDAVAGTRAFDRSSYRCRKPVATALPPSRSAISTKSPPYRVKL